MDDDHSGLASLVGDRLTAITFVHDYVQFAFDGGGLTAFSPPRVLATDATRTTFPQPGSRDVLCALIGIEVQQAGADDGRIRVEFTDGRALEIPVKDASYTSAEAAIFRPREGTMVVW